jgi:hypothetical protein
MPVATATATTTTTAPANGTLKLQATKAEGKKDPQLVDPYNYVGEVLGDVPADYAYAEFLRELKL